MDVLAEIKQELISGKQPVELIKDGYAKSSVYYVAKKLGNAHLDKTRLTIDDEVAELRRKREIIRLEKDIAELEAGKERLPERVAKLEAAIQELKDTLFELWAKQAVEAVRELSCPAHGHTMGIVMKCKECDYEMGLGWRT